MASQCHDRQQVHASHTAAAHLSRMQCARRCNSAYALFMVFAQQLAHLLATERSSIQELQPLVAQEQRKVEKQRVLLQTVEDNMISLYESAKSKLDERQQRLLKLRSDTHDVNAGRHHG